MTTKDVLTRDQTVKAITQLLSEGHLDRDDLLAGLDMLREWVVIAALWEMWDRGKIEIGLTPECDDLKIHLITDQAA